MNHHQSTIERYRLRTYTSKYAGTCSICRRDFQPGDEIVQIAPILPILHKLGLSSKVFKYVHLECLPVYVDGEHRDAVRRVAKPLLDMTDPNWPKDHIGLSAGDASPFEKWFAADCHPLGTVEIARRLRRYRNTQLESDESDVQTALEIGGLQGYRAVVEWRNENGDRVDGGGDSTRPEPQSESELRDEFLGVIVKERKIRGEAFVTTTNDGQLAVYLDPPWINDNHGRIKDQGKKIGARWNPKDKIWTLRPTLFAVNPDPLTQDGVSWSRKAIDLVAPILQRSELARAAEVDDDDLDRRLDAVLPDGLELRPFQKAGVKFLEVARGRALVGDEMGLGKTVQAIAYARLNREDRPVVCVVPAIVAANWGAEIAKWTGGEEKICRAKNGKQVIPADAGWIVVTYGLLKKHLSVINRLGPAIIIFDECHYLKNVKAQRTKTALALCKSNPDTKIIGLSGTPIVNRPVEFFTILKLLKPSDFKNWMWFTKRYCNGHHTRWGYKRDGATNTEELSARLRDVMVRRLKSDVLSELPAKQRVISEVKIDAQSRRAYRQAIAEASEGEGGHLAAITAGRYQLGLAKVKPALQWIAEYYDQGLPLVVFVHHKDVLASIVAGARELGCRVAGISGATSHDDRGRVVDDFQAGNLDVVVISTKAGGVGITLTRASDVLFVERQWTPADEEQAEDRCHRIGQESAVQIRYLAVEGNTIDKYIADLLEEKRDVLRSVLDGETVDVDLDIRKQLIARVFGNNK